MENNSGIDISVLTTVFNEEPYIEQAIRSAEAQTGIKLEIICIDDGSTDRSAEIVQGLAGEYGNILLVRHDNRGAGVTQNEALMLARGRYLAFLGGDDYFLDDDCMKTMIAACEDNDVAICSARIKTLTNGNFSSQSVKSKLPVHYDGRIYSFRKYQMRPGYCSMVIRSDLVKENHIWFPTTRRYQDEPFDIDILYYADNVFLLNKDYYCGRLSNSSDRLKNSRIVYEALKASKILVEKAIQYDLDFVVEEEVNKLSKIKTYLFRSLNTETLSCLLEINQAISDYKKDPDYVAEPIRDIFRAVDGLIPNVSEIKQTIQEADSFYVYGAGVKSAQLFEYLKEQDSLAKVEGVLVTSAEENPEMYYGKKVLPLREVSFDGKKELVLVAIDSETIYQEIRQRLDVMDCTRTIHLSSYVLGELMKEKENFA